MGVGGYNAQTGSEAIDNNRFDLLAIGRPFIANPDYVPKVKTSSPGTEYSEEMLAELV
jgi:2,4-dienoyl-CoA reductase-like NADH-dependent reductase (Old Yellow Enzyme family)